MIRCDDGAQCPGTGFECREEPAGMAFCVRPDFAGTCAAAVEPPVTPTQSMGGTGGSGAAGASGAGGGPSPGAGEETTVDACVRSGRLRIEPCAPPPPCAGVPYRANLAIASGAGKPVWRVSPADAGLAIDADTGALSGVVSEAVTLEVTVSDGVSEGRVRYGLEPRSSCWFAYVSGAPAEATRVHLVDPILLDDAPRHDLPEALPDGASVVDFRFSPDGRWLAVRVDVAGARHLEIFAAPNWVSLGVAAAGGSVVDYAWAPNAPLLALAADTAEGRVLGGVRLSSTADAGGPGDASALLASLEPVAAPVASPLVWFGADAIAFHAPQAEDPESHEVYSGVLEQSEFASVARYTGTSYTVDEFESLSLLPSRTAFFAVTDDGAIHNIRTFEATSAGPAPLATFPDDALISPTGEHLARAAGGQLEIYRASDRSPTGIDIPPPIATAPDCNRVLAWSGDGSRVACVTDADVGSLYVFTLTDTEQLTAALVEGDYEYPEQLVNRRRAFAPGGRWFTFATDYTLYSVDLSQPRLQQQPATARVDSANAAADLILAPDGESVLTHAASGLTLRRLATLDAQTTVTREPLAPALPCVESAAFPTDRACGTARSRSSEVVWSPDSQSVAFRTAASELRMFHPQRPAAERSISNACDESCIITSDFQPSFLNEDNPK